MMGHGTTRHSRESLLAPKRSRRWAVGMAVAAVTAGSAVPALASGPTMITSCTESAVQAAIAHGGTVDFAQNCQVLLSSTLTLTKLDLDLEANGHSVQFNGQGTVRVMSISGGNVTLGGLELVNGAVTGAAGAAGIAPATGHTGGGAKGAGLLVSSGVVTLNDDVLFDDDVQ